MSVLQSIFGFVVLGAIAWACCRDRRRIPWKTVIAGAVLQIALAAVLLKVPLFRQLFLALNDMLLSLEQATKAGTSFVFGYLGGGSLPFEESYAG
ncbi:MAG: Na+ dependent nucleoside transporter N-terminal domain-containing protein, partial [Acidiferrobacterales bacterium]